MFARCFADVFSKYRQAMNDLGIDLVCNDRTSLLFMRELLLVLLRALKILSLLCAGEMNE